MIGKLTDNQIDTILISGISGRLACCLANKPYVVPVAYAYQAPFIYCHAIEGLKISVMRENPNICFEVDQIDNLANWRSVIVMGTFEELTHQDQEEAIQILKNRFTPIQTSIFSKSLLEKQAKILSPKPAAKEVIFRIFITEKSGRFEKSE